MELDNIKKIVQTEKEAKEILENANKEAEAIIQNAYRSIEQKQLFSNQFRIVLAKEYEFRTKTAIFLPIWYCFYTITLSI